MRAALGLAALLAAASLAGCGGGGGSEPELPQATLAIGAVPGPTGWDAEVLDGVRVAVREINRRGGIDERLLLELRTGRPAAVARARLPVVVLPCDARAQAAAAGALGRTRAVLLAPCNTELWRRFRRVWPVSVSPHDEARALLGYVADSGCARLAVVGEGRAARAVRREAAAAGLTLTSRRRAQCVAVALAAPFAAATVARLRAAGVTVPIVATHGLDDRSAIRRFGHALDGVVFSTFGYADPGSKLDEFDERYRALTGSPPSTGAAALGYDAVQVLAAALHDAASTAPAALAANLPGEDASGATGDISYPERRSRDPAVSVALVRVARGRLVLVDRVDV